MPRRDTWGTAGAVGIGVGIGIGLSLPFMRGNERERRRTLKGLVRACSDVGDVLTERFAETEGVAGRVLARTALRLAWPLATTALRHGPLLVTVVSALRPLLARR